jgi:hypothetical protein
MRPWFAILLLLAGCGAETPPPRPSSVQPTASTVVPTTTTTTTVPTAPFRTVDHDTHFAMGRSACAGGAPYNPASLPYRGTGLHWTAVMEMPATSGNTQNASVTSLGPGMPTPNNVNLVQLLACVTPSPGARAGNVTCEFDKDVNDIPTSRTWPFLEASYQVTVREARSGREVHALTLAGNATPGDSCPGFATDDPDTVVLRSLTDEALGAALEPLVDGTA